jgi:hypothetical protein
MVVNSIVEICEKHAEVPDGESGTSVLGKGGRRGGESISVQGFFLFRRAGG